VDEYTFKPSPNDRLYSEQQVFWGTSEAIDELPLLGLLTKEGKRAIVDAITNKLRGYPRLDLGD
jgi:hypothetical protein